MINLPEAVDNYIKEKHEEEKQPNITMTQMSNGLVKPFAQIYTSYGDDGRAFPRDIIEYKCPKCMHNIHEGDIGCIDCRIFFDWSKKAKIKVIKQIVWE